MKKLSIILGCLLLWIACHARGGQPPSSPWIVYKWGNSGQYRPFSAAGVGGDIATFPFPSTGNNVAYPALLTTTTVSEYLGNLSGQTVSATLSVTATGNPDFVWGGLLSGWNTCCLPANTRLFISTSAAAYSNSGYTACPSCYWWATSAWVEIAPTGAVTISALLDPSLWSNAQGQLGTSEPTAFANAVANVRQIGLSYGGGSFYDVGIAVLNGSGTATFHLLSFSAQ